MKKQKRIDILLESFLIAFLAASKLIEIEIIIIWIFSKLLVGVLNREELSVIWLLFLMCAAINPTKEVIFFLGSIVINLIIKFFFLEEKKK